MALRSPRLSVECLEARTLLSSAAAVLPLANLDPVLTATPIAVMHQVHLLAGRGTGTFTNGSLVVDAGPSEHLTGSGHFAALGDVTISGWVNGVGMIQQGRAQGVLQFTNSHGSVTIDLQGPVQSGFSSIPVWFHYKVVSATGAYQHLNDHGTLRIDTSIKPVVDPLPPGVVHTLPIPNTGTFRIAI